MRWFGLVMAVTLVMAGCSTAREAASTPPQGSTESKSAVSPFPDPGPYEQTVDAAAKRGLAVWLDGDLLRRWAEGPASFDAAVDRLSALAARRGVVGIKIADELGYHDAIENNPSRMRAFLTDAAAALRPRIGGRRILVDILVPELGCAPGVPDVRRRSALCRLTARMKFPALTLDQIDHHIGSGTVDAVDLSTYLLPASTYRSWGIDRMAAQKAAWQEVERRGWSRKVTLHSRRALAHPDDYRGDTRTAEADVEVFVDVPIDAGAKAASIWTWRQRYQGEIVRLLDPGLRPNALWHALLARRRAGSELLTSFSPSSTERGVGADLDMLSRVFTGVYVAAGIG
jgi:hypothetical protein